MALFIALFTSTPLHSCFQWQQDYERMGKSLIRKSSERCLWKKGSHASASASLMVYKRVLSWQTKFQHLIHAVTQLHARDVARDWQTLHSHKRTCNQYWSRCGNYSSGTSGEQDFCSDHVIKGFLILSGNNRNHFHLQTSMDQLSCHIVYSASPILASRSQTPAFHGFARYLTIRMGKS